MCQECAFRTEHLHVMAKYTRVHLLTKDIVDALACYHEDMLYWRQCKENGIQCHRSFSICYRVSALLLLKRNTLRI